MSKSKENAVDPWALFHGEGADAVRWALVRSGAPGAAHCADLHAVTCARVKFLGTLWNLFRWLHMRAEQAGGWAVLESATTVDTDQTETARLPAVDRWVLSRLASVALEVDAAFTRLELHVAATVLEAFVLDDLSNWYLKFARARFSGGAASAAAQLARQRTLVTLRRVMLSLCRLLAPLVPFVTDYLHRALFADASVHLESWPVDRDLESLVDGTLEAEMRACRELVRAGRRMREQASWPGRLPLAHAWVGTVSGRSLEELWPLLADELNVREVAAGGDLSAFHDKRWRLNRSRLGPQCQRELPAVEAAYAALPTAVANALAEPDGELQLAGHTVTGADLQVVTTPRAGYVVAEATAGVPGLVLEFNHNDVLLSSWLARELVHSVQMRRRELELPLGAPVALKVRMDAAAAAVLLPADWQRLLADARADPHSVLHVEDPQDNGDEKEKEAGAGCDQKERWQKLTLRPPHLAVEWRVRVLVH